MEEQNELKQNEGIIIKKQKFIKYKIKKQIEIIRPKSVS